MKLYKSWNNKTITTLSKNVDAWATDFGKAGDGYASLVKSLPKWDQCV